MALTLSTFDSYKESNKRSHLHLLHGTYVYDVKTEQGLDECHESQHQNPDSMFHVKHEHKSVQQHGELELQEEWVW